MGITIRTLIPRNEIEMGLAKEGDIVKISFYDDRADNMFRSVWSIFKGNLNGVDRFIAQEKAKSSLDTDLVARYSSQRNKTQFDYNLGVILNDSEYSVEYIGPAKEGYILLREELRSASLWKE